MTLCPGCHSELPAGVRWCPVCHANVRIDTTSIASPSQRLGAHIMDLAMPVVAFLFMSGSAGVTQSSVVGMLLFLGYIGWALTLFARGMTPGKRLIGIRVIKESGEPAGFGTMFFREWIGKFISSLFFGLGFLWILIDKDRQAWHDKLFSTYVVQ